MSVDSQAIEVQKKPYVLADVPLVREMAKEYGFGDSLQRFEVTLINTVFPANVQVTNSQFLIFIKVAQQYNLNPLTRQIFAFPSKGGGIVPIVSIDGWISIVQRQPNYNGHKFIYEWEAGKIGGKVLSCTCQIFRKDLENSIDHTEFFEECYRDTEPWKKWPRRMLTHKSFSQASRYAFGLTGIYDEDEGQRIIEAEMVTVSALPSIKQPQRIASASEPPKTNPTTVIIESQAITEESTPDVTKEQAPYGNSEDRINHEDESATPTVYFTADDVPGAEPDQQVQEIVNTPTELVEMFEAPKDPVDNKKPGTIGPGRARRIYAILNKNKAHSEDELKSEILLSLKIDHLRDLPEQYEEEIVAWAEGKRK